MNKFTTAMYRFVGMLPQKQLQDYLVRAVAGYGERVQAAEVSDKDLADTTNKISTLAGLSSISFQKKEKLNTLVGDVLNRDGAFVEGSNFKLTSGMQAAMKLIDTCRTDIRVRF